MNKNKQKDTFFTTLAVLLIAFCVWLIWVVFSTAWEKLSALDTNLAIGLLTASTTVIVAALTVTLGRYYERKKDIEAHFRERKVEIYDEFLKEFFKWFTGDDKETPNEQNLVVFLREWQRKMILWGGSDVLSSYLKWRRNLSAGEPNAQTMFLTEDFFKSIRKDLGLSNRGLEKGIFVYFILRNADLFLQMAKENPKVTLEELGKMEEELALYE